MRSGYFGSLVILLMLGGTPPSAAVQGESAETAPATPAAVAQSDEEIPVKRVKMWARSWKWTPDSIRVKKGTRVIIDFFSEDASHAFQLKAYKIKVNLPQDTRAQLEFIAYKAGTFKWRCSRPCGDGCAKMVGTLTVLE